eukprot:Trichotokara_eunicae@DN5640_c0_g1_i3.p1
MSATRYYTCLIAASPLIHETWTPRLDFHNSQQDTIGQERLTAFADDRALTLQIGQVGLYKGTVHVSFLQHVHHELPWDRVQLPLETLGEECFAMRTKSAAFEICDPTFSTVSLFRDKWVNLITQRVLCTNLGLEGRIPISIANPDSPEALAKTATQNELKKAIRIHVVGCTLLHFAP